MEKEGDLLFSIPNIGLDGLQKNVVDRMNWLAFKQGIRAGCPAAAGSIRFFFIIIEECTDWINNIEV